MNPCDPRSVQLRSEARRIRGAVSEAIPDGVCYAALVMAFAEMLEGFACLWAVSSAKHWHKADSVRALERVALDAQITGKDGGGGE